jgi:hypothetical protein
MHVRARLHRRRIQISLVDTHRVDGKVRQEHIASLGSVPPEMTPADRLAFWTSCIPASPGSATGSTKRRSRRSWPNFTLRCRWWPSATPP